LSADNHQTEAVMSDYRDPNDPHMRNMGYEPYPDNTKTGWAWVAAAVFLVIVLALAFNVGHEPNRVAANEPIPPAATPMTPPAGPTSPAAPSLVQPPTPIAPNQPPSAPNQQ